MIRKATSADCRDLAALHVLTWRQAYSSLMPQAFLDGRTLELETRSELWSNAIEERTASVFLQPLSQATARISERMNNNSTVINS